MLNMLKVNSKETSIFHDNFEHNPKEAIRKCSINKGVSKSIAKFTEKHLCWILFLTKLQASASNFIQRGTPTKVFFCEFCGIFRNSFIIEHFRWQLLTLSSTYRTFIKYLRVKNWKIGFLAYEFSVFVYSCTAWKSSVLEVFLVRIFPYLSRIWRLVV